MNHQEPRVETMEFDDMETFEHSRHRPLSITIAVEYKTRRLLGFRVSEMPSKTALNKHPHPKTEKRLDLRSKNRKDLFVELKPLTRPGALIKSDQNPHYRADVKTYFPLSQHQTFKGRRAAAIGQGELKVGKFDPLFSLNHTAAMLRANVSRLIRKTWCTTKKKARLEDHIALYAAYHNEVLIKK